MLTEIVNLVELIRQLVQRKSELDKEYFQNLIQPTWEAFVTVHKNYKESLTKYIDFLSKEEENESKLVNDLLETMKYDSLLSSDLRSELSNLVKHIPSSKMKADETHLLEFVKAIYGYFKIDVEYKLLCHAALENLRGGLISTIERVSASSMATRPDALRIYSEICRNLLHLLQGSYDMTANAYYKLRSEILG